MVKFTSALTPYYSIETILSNNNNAVQFSNIGYTGIQLLYKENAGDTIIKC
jgi:hypothetical protein